MPEQTTAISAETTTADQRGDRRPAITLLTVIAAW